jgi:hypothetical protein
MAVCTAGEATVGSSAVANVLRLCLEPPRPLPPAAPPPLPKRTPPPLVRSAHSGVAAPFPVKGGFVFTCNGRGTAHHDEHEAETLALAQAAPSAALCGFYSGGEFGPDDFGVHEAALHGAFSEGGANEGKLAEALEGLEVVTLPLAYSCVVSMFG